MDRAVRCLELSIRTDVHYPKLQVDSLVFRFFPKAEDHVVYFFWSRELWNVYICVLDEIKVLGRSLWCNPLLCYVFQWTFTFATQKLQQSSQCHCWWYWCLLLWSLSASLLCSTLFRRILRHVRVLFCIFGFSSTHMVYVKKLGQEIPTISNRWRNFLFSKRSAAKSTERVKSVQLEDLSVKTEALQ